MKHITKFAAPFALYFVYFALLFIQFPLSGSLPGKGDNWFFLAAYRNIGNYLLYFFTGMDIGTVVYPESNVYSFGNYSPGQAFFYLPLLYAGLNDITAYYIFNTFIFTFNATAVYLLAKAFKISRPFALLAGLFFAGCNFSYGNLDNPDALFLGFGLMAVVLLLKFFDNAKTGYFWLSISLLGVEVYFSSYGFLFAVLFYALVFLFHFNVAWIQHRWKMFLGAGVLLFVILLPYLNVYIFNPPMVTAYNPAETISAAGKASLKLADLTRPLKNNVYYSYLEHGDSNWINKTKSAFTGFILPVFGLWGILLYTGKKRKLLIVAFVLFLVVAFGPFLPIESREIPSPTYWLYQKFNLNQYLRISVRAYFFCVMILALGAAKLLEKMYQLYAALPVCLASIFIVLENTPVSFEKYNSYELIKASLQIPDFDNDLVVLNLPSSIYSWYYPKFKPECAERKDYEFEAIREHLYMFEQTLHKANTVNGLTGFIPKSRIKNQLLIDEIQEGNGKALLKMISDNKIAYIIWHKQLTNGCSYTETMQLLTTASYLSRHFEDDNVVIYKTAH